jgi:hypothetical protein
MRRFNAGLKVAAANGFVATKVADAQRAGAVVFALKANGPVTLDMVRKAVQKAGLYMVANGETVTIAVPKMVL